MTTERLIKTILFATDFSACADRAYQYALHMASAWDADINVLHVVEFQPGMNPEYEVNRLYLDHLRKERDQQIAMLLARERRPDLRVVKREAMGIPSLEINRIAQELEADLIVVGTRGRTGFEHVLLGSTAERVVTGAPCPVLTVRQAETAGQPIAGEAAVPITIKRILVPIDFSDCSLDALEYAAQVAHQFKAEVTLFHVMEPVAYSLDFTFSHPAELDQNRKRRGEQLSNLVAALRGFGLVAGHALRGGLPAEAILEGTRDQGSDLIVMGTHGRRGISHLVSGSVTEMVLRWARCPVLTVRSPKFSPGHKRLVPIGGWEETP